MSLPRPRLIFPLLIPPSCRQLTQALSEDQRTVVHHLWPRMMNAIDIARHCSGKLAASRNASSGSAAASAATSGSTPSASATASATTHRVRDHCRAVLQELEAQLCSEILPLPQRQPKRQRTDGAAAGPGRGPVGGGSQALGLRYQPVLELLGVMHRIRSLDLASPAPSQLPASAATAAAAQPAAAGAAGGGGGSCSTSGPMRLLALDAGGSVLHLPSALTAAATAAAAGGSAATVVAVVEDNVVKSAVAKLTNAQQVCRSQVPPGPEAPLG